MSSVLSRVLGASMVAALVAALVVVLPSSASAATVSESEPNATASMADVIPLGSTVSASTLSATYYDNDYFVFDVPSEGRATLSLNWTGSLGTSPAYEVEVYGASVNSLYKFTVTGNQGDGTWLASQATYVPAGRLYVRVYAENTDPTWGIPYTLTVSVAPGAVETEPNGMTATADVIALGSTVSASALGATYSDSDYFALDVPSAGLATLSLNWTGSLGTEVAYEVDVYNASSNSLYHFTVTGNQGDGTWLASQATYVPAGRLYVKVYADKIDPSWGNAYTLSVSVAAGTVETEPNGSTATADVIPLGATVSASALGADYSDTDYFAFDVPNAGEAALSLKWTGSLGTSDAYGVSIHSASGSLLQSFTVKGNQGDGAWLESQATSVSQGRIYVKVTAFNYDPSWGKPYTLAVTVVVPPEVLVVTGTPVRIADLSDVTSGVVICGPVVGLADVPVGAVGVLFNVTAAGAAGPGNVVVYPDYLNNGASPPPNASTVNFEEGRDVANAALVALPSNGDVCVFTQGARLSRFILDVTGYILPSSGISLQNSQRLMDTRGGSFPAVQAGPVQPNDIRTIQVTGNAGVPAGATAVLVNVTVTGVAAPGHLRMWAAGTTKPNTSVLNYAAGKDKANAQIVALSADGKISFESFSSGSTQVIIDVVGYVSGATQYVATTPTRIVETRAAFGLIGPIGGQLAPNTIYPVTISDTSLVPTGATAVVLNVTAVQPTGLGHIRVYPDTGGFGTTAPPDASTLNYIPGRDIPNLVIVKLPANRTIDFYNVLGGSDRTDLVVDVVGYIYGN